MRNFPEALLKAKTQSRLLVPAVVMAALAALAPLSDASAPPLTITVVNNSGWEIRHLYLSPAHNDDWGPDQLNDSSISPNGSRTINVSWDQSTVKLIAEDQDGCFMSTTVEASGSATWTIAANESRNCGS